MLNFNGDGVYNSTETGETKSTEGGRLYRLIWVKIPFWRFSNNDTIAGMFTMEKGSSLKESSLRASKFIESDDHLLAEITDPENRIPTLRENDKRYRPISELSPDSILETKAYSEGLALMGEEATRLAPRIAKKGLSKKRGKGRPAARQTARRDSKAQALRWIGPAKI